MEREALADQAILKLTEIGTSYVNKLRNSNIHDQFLFNKMDVIMRSIKVLLTLEQELIQKDFEMIESLINTITNPGSTVFNYIKDNI